MEQRIVQRLCPGAPVVRLGANGDGVAIEKIADRIYFHAKLMFRRVRFVHVVFDRENRDMSCEEIRNGIYKCLRFRTVDVNCIRISVADRNFEAWMAPFLNQKAVFCTTPVNDNAEGRNGKAIVSKIFKLNGKSYNETIDGVKAFCTLVPKEICEVSVSFRDLFNEVSEDCWWKTQK